MLLVIRRTGYYGDLSADYSKPEPVSREIGQKLLRDLVYFCADGSFMVKKLALRGKPTGGRFSLALPALLAALDKQAGNGQRIILENTHREQKESVR